MAGEKQGDAGARRCGYSRGCWTGWAHMPSPCWAAPSWTGSRVQKGFPWCVANGCGFPASARHPGHLGRSVSLRRTRPLLEEGGPCKCGGRAAVHPPPRAVALMLLRLRRDGEVRRPCWRAPRAALSDPAAQPVGSSVPSLAVRSSEARSCVYPSHKDDSASAESLDVKLEDFFLFLT